MGNMQMYANVCWMGRPEAQWEIKALRDGEGCGEGQHYELNAAILNKENQPWTNRGPCCRARRH